VTGCHFFAPSLEVLEALADPPPQEEANAAEAEAEAASGRGGGGTLGIGSLRAPR
jgi:hypothetical protein